VDLIKEFGGPHKADLLFSIAMHKYNNVAPDYRDVDLPQQFVVKYRTVAQRAYNAYIDASAFRPGDRLQLALHNGIDNPNQRELASRYLLKTNDDTAKAFGQFLEMYDLPGHTAMMQKLIDRDFRLDATSQKLIFGRMVALTDDPLRLTNILTTNLHKPALIGTALNKMDYMLTKGTTRQQREEMDHALSLRMEENNFAQEHKTHMAEILARIAQENKLQDALTVMQTRPTARVAAMHDLSVMHDQRAIKPLLQQAVSGHPDVAEEAIDALRQFSPSMVTYYAKELKREFYANPSMTSKITDLMNSHRWTSPPRSTSSSASSSSSSSSSSSAQPGA
jgi:hypothetical protein